MKRDPEDIARRVRALIEKEPCETCPHRGSFYRMGQSAICGRCPVFTCYDTPYEWVDDTGYQHSDSYCLVDPGDYREDWLIEWEEFFRSGKEPELWLEKPDETKEG